MSAPIGPYTPLVRAGPWLVSSGQLGLEPVDDRTRADGDGVGDGRGTSPAPPRLVTGGMGAQLTQALANGEALLRSEGAGLGDVVKTTVFVTRLDDYVGINQVYSACFGDHRPARSVVGVAALPLGALVEVELWAYVPSRARDVPT
ncbi:MAG: RidA family protein [Acidimicrobiales bacterium]